MPLKSNVIPYLDNLDPLAETIGAVNTIVNQNGSLRGTSTDFGFLRSLRENDVEPEGLEIVVLGAGGSARALLAGLADVKAKSIRVWNRTPSRANYLVEEIKPVFPNCMIEHIHSDGLNDLDCDLLVNTTSAGMQSRNPLRPQPCQPNRACCRHHL